ncbi:D-alanyl-lipoteichoic acid acyltransferase DltB, MBOAT superfamily [Butyrivibrio fibrisolvens DSM 3071]|uniref:D-alanyl-lipoteichoic acid acyltransferase DltB, MBOAT superfamily n=1 Tax=Butyrivibrio fibrisolvens DSM 3071 TaxID=1121131 RepID=A0A1M6FA11_BUTFI|nr:MBOAT family O-acyltransferase [Butyrivibrio fibrisolvens]SHI94449.1 D-alanyl-lipoteichoic acid acyltransferase DltB, MBOAT superfamily [Butyrivibrio fibrisolvens DSM 3071]
MEFYSLAFWGIIAIALVLYYTVMKSRQWICLLVFSVLYYGICGLSGVPYIIVTTLTTWFCGLMISRTVKKTKEKRKAPGLSRDEKKTIKNKGVFQKRIWLILDLAIVLMILACVKYLTVFEIFKVSGLILPLGISFYTFMAIAYIVDVYNEKYEPENNFFRLLLFLSFFPQVIQGPISRYDKLRSQYDMVHSWNGSTFKRAVWRFLFGALKKYAIADMLSGSISGIFDYGSEGLPGSLIVLGILMYSAQQYADFSGGIDMALAVSEMFGIELMPNFKRPYFATSLGDFWRRWHISLGAFMRDYVFYPFALLKFMQKFGKWCSKHFGKHFGRVLPAGIANILVFLLVGVWHGAEMHYVIWGLYNGLVIALSDICAPAFENINSKLKINASSKGMHIFRIVRTFIIVNIGWYFDRIYDFGDCIHCLHNTVTNWASFEFTRMFTQKVVDTVDSTAYLYGGYVIAVIGVIIVFVVSVLEEKGHDVKAMIMSRNLMFRSLIALVVILLILASFMLTTGTGGFMYANF